MTPDVVIVGGGVIGLTLAWELAGQGTQVTVLDQSQPGREASWAGAGMLPPGNSRTAVTPEQRLRGYSHHLWPELSQSLQEETAIDNGFFRAGCLELRPANDDFSGEQQTAEISAWAAEEIACETMTSRDVMTCEPNVADGLAGYRLPTFGQVRNPHHLQALASACLARGVQFLSGVPAVGFIHSSTAPGFVTGVRTPTEVISAGRICIASGAWSGPLLAHLNWRLPVKPIRGQIVLLRTDRLPFRHVLQQGKRYLVPRRDGRILVGATEEDVGYLKQNTAAGVAELLQFAQTICPALANAEIETAWSGLRPGSPDGLPFLGRIPEYENVFVAAGHFRAGLQMSPATARVMRQCLLEQPTDFSLEGLECQRQQDIMERSA